MRKCEVSDLGRIEYQQAFALQQDLVRRRRDGRIPDQLLLLEHPHVITMGRNGRPDNILAGEDVLARAGISVCHTDRGGDVTYHGPGQVVGYPILDLRDWRRDVTAYVRGLEQVIIDALAEFGLRAGREPRMTGVWVKGRKIAAIGVHLSRWVTSHGFALNVDTDLSYFHYIVPCGLTRAVTSMSREGAPAGRGEVVEALARHFGRVFACQMEPAAWVTEKV